MAEPLAVKLVESGPDLSAVSSFIGVVVAALSVAAALFAIYAPLRARRAEQREAQLTFRNILYVASSHATPCAVAATTGQAPNDAKLSTLQSARDLLEKLNWASLRPGPMTLDFAEAYMAIVEIAKCLKDRATQPPLSVSEMAHLKTNHDSMVDAMRRIDLKLTRRRNVRFEGDVAWYKSRFEL
jgi:hypothetical protein